MTKHVSPPQAPTSATSRVKVTLEGRYMVRGEESLCHTFEIWADGASLFAPAKATPGAEVILYLSALGRFPGVATGLTPTGFEMAFRLTPTKRAQLLEQLKWFADRETGGQPERRRHDRVVPLNPVTVLRLPWGAERVAKIESLSLSGVSIEADIWPDINSVVIVGNKPAIVMRHFDGGFACEFREHLEPDQLDETIRL